MTVARLDVGLRPYALSAGDLERLIQRIRERGYRLIGPTIRKDAITLGDVSRVDDLPRGWHDEQGPGSYRLRDDRDDELFGYAVGPHAAKSYLHPATWTLFRFEGEVGSVEHDGTGEFQPLALMLRPCEIAAMEVQDKVLKGSQYPDPVYRAFRDSALIIAINCGRPSANCFCTSMGTGPSAAGSYDLALTEFPSGAGFGLVIQSGSETGVELLEATELMEATDDDLGRSATCSEKAIESIEKSLDVEGLAGILMRETESPQWSDVAERCLTCLNCTMVCPTCFCTTVEDGLDLSGTVAERTRLWDSCFSLAFSYIHGGSIRQSASSRYRQWMTHKLASWIDQFGTRGCVGCGRCVTWCPSGIDITAEAAAMRERHGNAGETGEKV